MTFFKQTQMNEEKIEIFIDGDLSIYKLQNLQPNTSKLHCAKVHSSVKDRMSLPLLVVWLSSHGVFIFVLLFVQINNAFKCLDIVSKE